MRNDITDYTRLILKQTATTGEKGTIPASDDHTDGTWLSTDLYMGESLINITDNVLYTRTVSGITEIELGGADSEIFTKTVVVTYDKIRTLYSSPVELIPVDVSGRAIEVISAVGNLKFISTAYTTYFNLRIMCGAVTIAQFNEKQLLKSTTNRALKFIQSELSCSTDDQQIKNSAAINLTCDGDPIGGDSDITIFLTYRYITLP